MSRRSPLVVAFAWLLGGALAAVAAPGPPPAPGAGSSAAAAKGAARRTPLTAPDGRVIPYTVELPAGWQVTPSKNLAGLFLAPAGVASPETDPRVVYVRTSPASLSDPEAVVANIKKSDAADDTWTAPLVEVRALGGVRGVLVRMDSGSGIMSRSTLVLKMPFGAASVDFMTSGTRSEFERLLPETQRVILSVLPAR